VRVWLPAVSALLDIGAVFLAAVLAYELRFSKPLVNVRAPSFVPELSEYLLYGIALALIYALIARSYRSYSPQSRPSLEQEIGRILLGTGLSMGVILAIIFFYREFDYSRAVFLGTLILMVPLLILSRAAFYHIQRTLFEKSVGLQRVALWGWGPTAANLWEELEHARSQGFELVGAIGEPPVSDASSLGDLQSLPDLISKYDIDLIVFAPPPGEEDRMAEGLSAAEGLPVELLYVPGAIQMAPSQMQLAEIGGKPLLRLRALPPLSRRYVVKRLFDICASFILVLCAVPFMLAIGLVVLWTSGWPIFIRERHVGVAGKEFGLLRFHVLPSSRFGGFLARWRLDKLPQLLNVLRGDMSLVGPTPAPLETAEELLGQFPVYLDRRRMKSGITGWAQVQGIETGQSAEYNLHYIEHWTLGFDLRILLLAIGRLLRGKNAF
jgi:lipopolysaccharide/colanic/teichoic acid biosynthesis glycosyltransferase